LALGSGATDDAVAWSRLAIVFATSKGGPSIAAWAISSGVAFVLLMLTIGKAHLARLGTIVEKVGKLSQGMLGMVLLIVFAGTWFTDVVGIYAAFGAFVIGIAMPSGKFAGFLRERLDRIKVGLFLLFFSFTRATTPLSVH
jgi:Kef-type K+ transport system membrane component KefB